MSPAGGGGEGLPLFLSRRSLWAALALIAALPFIVAPLPMMPDWFGHVGRYHVMLHGGSDPFLARYYAFRWALIGNLGLDLPMVLLGPLLGTEAAARLLAALIAPLGIWGLYLLARAGRGHGVPAGAFLALPLLYSRSFVQGFTNFCLSEGLAFAAAALWERFSDRPAAVRWTYGMAAGLLVWLAHVGGWALLVVLVGAFELVRAWEGRPLRAAWRAAGRIVPLAAPLVPTLLWRAASTGAPAEPHEYFFALKLVWLGMLFRGEFYRLDIATTAVLVAAALAVVALFLARRLTLRPHLAIASAVLFVLFLALPQWLLGSYYADMRLLAPALILLFLAARPASPAVGRSFAAIGLLLFAAQVGATSVGWRQRALAAERDLAVLDQVPRGARIATLAPRSDCLGWAPSAHEHLPNLAIVRRSAFVNSEFAYAGQNLMQPVYNRGRDFNGIPSNLIAGSPDPCGGRPLAAALAALPRERFDFVWIFDAAPPARLPWLQPVAAGPHGRLYRIAPAG